MAKDKKRQSIVGNKFPNPEEARKAAGEILGDSSTPTDMGRPRATHGLTRTSVMLDKDKMQRLKIIAAKEGRYIYELLDEALSTYLRAKE